MTAPARRANTGLHCDDRLEAVNRIKFWRFLTGDDQCDVGYFLSRLENRPATGTASAFASVR